LLGFPEGLECPASCLCTGPLRSLAGCAFEQNAGDCLQCSMRFTYRSHQRVPNSWEPFAADFAYGLLL
jgi:hypothetical protein